VTAFDKPIIHGLDHSPGAADPAYTGPWHYIGGTDEPDFENGWDNIGGDDNVPMRYRLIVGPPNRLKIDGTLDQLQPRKSIEIQGDVDGGADGTTVFTLPLAHRLDYSVPFPSHDNAGNYVPCRLYKDGTFVRGTP
jgi:hypothetical protein